MNDDKQKEIEKARNYCIQQATPSGLHIEVLEAFDRYIKEGEEPERAAWMALMDWDI